LRHLIISREFPPAAYPPGGIGTYVGNIARLLAEAGETVHVIGECWSGAPLEHEERCEGRLLIHRVRLDEPIPGTRSRATSLAGRELRLLGASRFPGQRFAWQAALLAERLIDAAGIDLIEGQEWEAPLYYLLLRRTLGLGPARRPPCMVHLHSPTELIFRYNEWTAARPEYQPMVRYEEYCIGAADALLCPSRYLANQLETRYGLAPDAISVIPYPAGDFPFVPREPRAWAEHRIAYIGRLEPRKGLLEFVEAAVEVARDHRTVCFDLVGDDVRYRGSLSVRRYMESRIPRALRERFRFYGGQPRARLPRLLARARAAVIPSRWENFPNTCIEAMCSGLPVIASPTGGMVEMLEDGVTGWIAPSQAPADLADTLRRALETPAAECEAMGRAAVEAIHGRCGNEVTTRRHLAKRAEVAQRGATRSTRVPDRLNAVSLRAPALDGNRRGLGIVVDALGDERSTRALQSIEAQSSRPAAVTVLNQVSDRNEASQAQAVSRAIRALVEDHGVAGVALVPGSAALTPDFVALASTALDRDPELGILSGWLDDGADGFVRPCPAFPYQWIADDVADVLVVRAEAFMAAGGLRKLLPPPYARWDLCNAILVAGWKAVSFPAVVATVEAATSATPRDSADAALLVRALRERFPEEFARDSAVVASLVNAPPHDGELRARDVLRMPVRAQLSLALTAARNPRRALGWLRQRLERFGK
jgi:glycosyltransferase involved in cell wall biosynthesis